MKFIKENHHGISTVLAFALIPLSGFATDIYIPSLPSMAADLNASNAAVQLSLLIFMISYGSSQWFIGSFLDSFGRYRLGIAALLVFTFASFSIGLSHNIHLIYVMRVIQGICVSLIAVGKRAYFVDIYSGEKLRHYTSMFSIIWATAPIVAPFLGGYLQTNFGWHSNFYFLGIAALLLLILELKYSGESLKTFQPFKMNTILKVYGTMIKTPDFVLGLVIIALCYSMVIVYGMTSPFIIEHLYHYSPVVTGYCSLLSGLSLMAGGIISKSLIKRPFSKKIATALIVQAMAIAGMLSTSGYASNLYTLMAFTIVIHMVSGFIFNNLFAYCLGRFQKNAGIASGITGGSLYVLTSFLSYSIASVLSIKTQTLLAEAYLLLALVLWGAFALFTKARTAHQRTLATA
ncbi:MFS transporter [Chitinophaga filiformis]|uniref:MFS transporter n=1 Tax=Chitinophaga filiformis TaxID=104663 RepID=A0ABY4HT95_CHIFI|nr:MFS transporter [Chitinophaga filiformis]UPK67008.1 MFS transporter [Chitinophaga filiformis]